jgi:mono/diheme cytochrome c family protein
MVRRPTALVLGSLLMAAALSAQAQEKSSATGQQLYEGHCGSCHGSRAGGDGWMSRFLTRTPPALNNLSQHFGGKFPAEIVRTVVDGRRQVAMHGPRDMPVWADVFDKSHAAPNIQALVDYLEQIQR